MFPKRYTRWRAPHEGYCDCGLRSKIHAGSLISLASRPVIELHDKRPRPLRIAIQRDLVVQRDRYVGARLILQKFIRRQHFIINLGPAMHREDVLARLE